ncbi:methionyl-tRNA formyltransferase [bacterium]|nr:methionyl-tRNA formyltransferase [bacterium]MBT4894831.1 methionyl-tRNA formyltransferase [bacterium]
MTKKSKIVFFGTPEISVIVLNELKKAGLTPALVVTMPDKPKGRKLVLSPPPAKVWAQDNKVDFIQPEKLDESFLELLRAGGFNLFVVASYGKILKQELLDIPKHGTLNVHPSLLPKLRGASPIISAILEDEKKTGVTIMLLDAGMDSGPILAQASIEAEPWPPKATDLGELLVTEGGKMLAEVIPQWIAGEIKPEVQDHDKATFTKKVKKEDGLIELDGDPYQNLLKIRAFNEWPGTYFFAEKNDKQIRVKITDADLNGDKLKINKVIPEGRKEMDYKDFLRG